MQKPFHKLYAVRNQNTDENFVEYLLKRMKRSPDFSVVVNGHALKAHRRAYHYQEQNLSRSEAKQLLLDTCQRVQQQAENTGQIA